MAGNEKKMETSNPVDTGTKERVSVLMRGALTKRVMLFIISKNYTYIEKEYKEMEQDTIAPSIPIS